MWKFCLVVSEIVQQASLFQTVSRNATKKSVFGVSCDFSVYFWLYTVCSAISAALYLHLETIQQHYSLRYPVYPHIHSSNYILAVHAVGSIVSTTFLVQMFYRYKSTLGYSETTSLVCNCVLMAYGGSLLWVLHAYVRQRATVIALDVADCFWLIGALSRSFMLILQVSVNWFFLNVAVMHRNFRLWQMVSLVFAAAGLAQAHYLGFQWYEIPTNAPPAAAVVANVVCVGVILLQTKLYRCKKGYSAV